MEHHLDVMVLDAGGDYDRGDQERDQRDRKKDAPGKKRQREDECRRDRSREYDRFAPAFVLPMVVGQPERNCRRRIPDGGIRKRAFRRPDARKRQRLRLRATGQFDCHVPADANEAGALVPWRSMSVPRG